MGAGTLGLGNLAGTALADEAQSITRKHLVQKVAKPRGEISLSLRISLIMLVTQALIRFIKLFIFPVITEVSGI
ncbi:MAG: hypothetical protein HC856_05385 [Pseudanabaena sp. RU_4_16]|nr:hypothetical protein [Pseudanabaena sp. RU_4_16]